MLTDVLLKKTFMLTTIERMPALTETMEKVLQSRAKKKRLSPISTWKS